MAGGTPLTLQRLTLLSQSLLSRCSDANPDRVRTRFALGYSYAVASAQHWIRVAQSVSFDVRFIHVPQRTAGLRNSPSKRKSPGFPCRSRRRGAVVVAPRTLGDARGWLGDALWTHDSIHLLNEDYEAQAQLIWNDEFHALFGCEPLAPEGSQCAPAAERAGPSHASL